jgi:hypothetical protein
MLNISIASEWDQAEGVALARDFDMKASMSHGPESFLRGNVVLCKT